MSLSNAIKFVNEVTASLPADSGSINPEERAALMAACDKLRLSLETPGDTATRLMTGTHFHVAAIIAIQMGVFDAMVGKPDGTSIEQLASDVNADPKFLVRIMRALTGVGFFRQIGEEKYAPNPKTGSFVRGAPLANAILQFGVAGEILVKSPSYFAKNKYQNPDDTYSGPFQYAFDTKLQYFEWLDANPEQQKAFNSMMEMNRHKQSEAWFNFYPVEERLRVKDANAPLLVDIGGGKGLDITAFQAKFPNLPGRLIMQDLPTTIDEIKEVGPNIELMKYDFFKPQPVKDARAYYLRNIIHDWPDKQARQILERAREAMNDDSLLLLNENALLDENIPLWSLALDLTMMAYFSAYDRTVKQYMELIESVGFRVLKVWTTKAEKLEPIFVFEAVKK